MKQSSIEWLYERLERMIPKSALYDIDKKHYFEQAKEMHKQEIIDSYASGYIDGVAQNKITAEHFYNKTFKL